MRSGVRQSADWVSKQAHPIGDWHPLKKRSTGYVFTHFQSGLAAIEFVQLQRPRKNLEAFRYCNSIFLRTRIINTFNISYKK